MLVQWLPGTSQAADSTDREKVGLKLNIQKTKIIASGPITSWKIDGETMETVTDLFWGHATLLTRALPFLFLFSLLVPFSVPLPRLRPAQGYRAAKKQVSGHGMVWPTPSLGSFLEP